MKKVLLVALALSLSACSVFGGKKTRLVPQAYMPEPPGILMQAPKELNTIKRKAATNNLVVSDTSVSVEGPK